LAALDDVVTKSGTGAFHGSVHKYFRNDTLDANDFFLNSSGSTKIELSPNNFGATFTNHEALRRWKDERVLSIGPGLRQSRAHGRRQSRIPRITLTKATVRSLSVAVQCTSLHRTPSVSEWGGFKAMS